MGGAWEGRQLEPEGGAWAGPASEKPQEEAARRRRWGLPWGSGCGLGRAAARARGRGWAGPARSRRRGLCGGRRAGPTRPGGRGRNRRRGAGPARGRPRLASHTAPRPEEGQQLQEPAGGGGYGAALLAMAAAVAMETDDAGNRLRFQLELEFVQCLANPNYLNFLAQRGYFKDKAFVNYLKYLLYWKEPEYAKYLKYPQCLHMLELLQYEHFRKELVSAQCAKFIDEQQILHWQHYSRKRMRLQQALAEQQQQNSAAGK